MSLTPNVAWEIYFRILIEKLFLTLVHVFIIQMTVTICHAHRISAPRPLRWKPVWSFCWARKRRWVVGPKVELTFPMKKPPVNEWKRRTWNCSPNTVCKLFWCLRTWIQHHSINICQEAKPFHFPWRCILPVVWDLSESCALTFLLCSWNSNSHEFCYLSCNSCGATKERNVEESHLGKLIIYHIHDHFCECIAFSSETDFY